MPPLAIGDDDLETLCGVVDGEHPRGRGMTADRRPRSPRCGARAADRERAACAGCCGRARSTTTCSTSPPTTTSGWPATPGSPAPRPRRPAAGAPGRPARGWSPAAPTLHAELEADLAGFVGAEAGLVFSSGYLANLGALTALAGPGALVVSDALNHASRGRRLPAVAGGGRGGAPPGRRRRSSGRWRGVRPDRAVVVTDAVFSRRRRPGAARRAARGRPPARCAAGRRRGARARRHRRRGARAPRTRPAWPASPTSSSP